MRTLNAAILLMTVAAAYAAPKGIAIYDKNPRYWQYNGKPVLLIGGSVEDNLFQIANLKEHLDLLQSVGGNYVRNAMSSRDAGDAHPFRKLDNGKYDLDQFDEEYWRRFETFLELTRERDIIVQIELWDMWDMHGDTWTHNTWNPANNVTYTHENTRLKAAYVRPGYGRGTSHGAPHDFFMTVPALHHDRVVLACQQRFVDKLLSYSLKYDNVLYCISNEIHPQYPPQWGWYWAAYLRKQALAAGRGIEVAEMYWTLDLKADQHLASLDRPDVYSFFEASQNSAILDPEEHWGNLQHIYRHLGSRPRPINNTKIYGADSGAVWTGTTRNAQEKFWRNIIGGSASSRFHRPPSGLGLSDAAQAHIKSLRMLTDAINVVACEPNNDLLSERSANEAYCLAEPGKQYAVYFPDGGAVRLDTSAARGAIHVRWLDIAGSAWQEPQTVQSGHILDLQAPGRGHWAVLVTAD
ncbi:MAG: hypothetical protein IH624_18640 [Phycisphaerae bacterium]|nr:hypothetical protein [Phycisphaerae bacterium]